MARVKLVFKTVTSYGDRHERQVTDTFEFDVPSQIANDVAANALVFVEDPDLEQAMELLSPKDRRKAATVRRAVEVEAKISCEMPKFSVKAKTSVPWWAVDQVKQSLYAQLNEPEVG